MSCDKETIMPVGAHWDDKFGGTIYFKRMINFCGGTFTAVAEMKIYTPFGDIETIRLEDGKDFNKTYSTSKEKYTVELNLFCGMETTAVQANTCLTDIPQIGNINCNSTPPSAQIFLDGNNTMQYTPHVLTGVSAGSHRIDYYLTDHDTCGVTVNVPVGGTAQANCTLNVQTVLVNVAVKDQDNVIVVGCAVNIPDALGAKTIATNMQGIAVGFTLEKNKSYVAAATPPNGYTTNTGSSTTFTADVDTTIQLSLTKDPVVGSIRCQAMESSSNAALAANIFFDGADISQTTPFIIQDVTPGPHTIVFTLEGYAPDSDTLTISVGVQAEALGNMVQLEVPGFDISVNIQGLLPNSSLFIFEVDRIPLTDTWWDSPIGSGMRWDNIVNRTYFARESRADCEPEPAFHQSLRPGQDYVIYVGTSAISLYPGTLVHGLTTGTSQIELTDSYVDWVSTTLCTTFDISPAQCSNFLFTSVSDAAFLLEQWKIITEHKNLAGEDVTPTALDFALIPIAIFGMFSPGLSEGKITQIIGKRITDLIEISKKGSDQIKGVLLDDIVETFVMRASDSQFDEFVRLMDNDLPINARQLLSEVDNIPMSADELHALHRASNMVEQIDNDLIRSSSIEKISTVLSRFSDKSKNVYYNALQWTRDNPKQALGIGILTIWFMVDNIPFYIYMYLKSKGRSPGDKSWQGKLTADVIDQYKFNVIEAGKLQAWDVFCENLLLWKQEVDSFEQFVADNESTLRNEETYDIYIETIAVYREAIKIKLEVHDCWQEPLPESFNATVTEIVDGDTVKINYNDKEYDVRILGINTPEGRLYDYTCTSLREPFLVRRLTTPGNECIDEETWHVDEEFLNSTTAWLAQELPVNQIATFKSDLTRQFDKYNRLLAVPFKSDENISIKSLTEGQSVVFFYDINSQVNQTDFLAAEKIASDANIGIWPFSQGPEKTGWIRFVSDPTAAEVYLDGVKIGNTVSNVLMWETELGLHDYEFKKVGYIGCKGTIFEINDTHTESSPYEKTCTLEPEDEPCPNPNASFAVSETKPKIGDLVTFNATASTPGTGETIESYKWNFGDGETATGIIVSHSFEIAGLFVVKLEVENDCGNSDSATKNITVQEATVEPATWEITDAKDTEGNILSAAKTYVDDIYIGHYAPETIEFCPGCTCDTVVPCGFGEHTVSVRKTGYRDWSNTRTLAAGNVFTDDPVMEKVFEIEILSSQEGATISVDGETVTTSLNLIQQLLLEGK